MTIKEKLLIDLQSINQPWFLQQIYQFVQLIKRNSPSKRGNREQVLAFAGTLSKEEAEKMQIEIDTEFHHIEGEW